MSIYYIIPARKGSKGFPGKNRRLFPFTYSLISDSMKQNTIVTSDDPHVLEMAKGCKKIKRDKWLSSDIASTKLVMCDVVEQYNLKEDDVIIMLYLTYPQRTIEDIQKAYEKFHYSCSSSLLCRKDVKTHPYLCINADNTQVIPHDLYRRQDYPVVHEISHYVCIFRVGELQNLNNNLYNEKTYFHYIPDVVDIDYEKDLLLL